VDVVAAALGEVAAVGPGGEPAVDHHTSRRKFQPSTSSLMVRMIEVSPLLPTKVQQRTAIPSRVTVTAMTTCGKSAR